MECRGCLGRGYKPSCKDQCPDNKVFASFSSPLFFKIVGHDRLVVSLFSRFSSSRSSTCMFSRRGWLIITTQRSHVLQAEQRLQNASRVKSLAYFALGENLLNSLSKGMILQQNKNTKTTKTKTKTTTTPHPFAVHTHSKI